jgi:chemotaxis protein methyltransferase CheR
MPLSPATAEEVRVLGELVRGRSGIELDHTKAYLFDSRLVAVAEAAKVSSLSQLIQKIRTDGSGALAQSVIDALSTGETSFFREPDQYHLIGQHLVPQHYERGPKNELRIWSSAVSSGQELYSLCILLREMLGNLRNYPIRMLGTDISKSILAQASRGRYSRLEVTRGLSEARIERNFRRDGDGYVVDEELRALVSFRWVNLLEVPSDLGQFDLVLCRNVGIYFSLENRERLYGSIRRHLRPGGVLLISRTETLGANPAPYVRREHRGVVYYELPG